ncbi:MAG: RrF2 family transcriptional regulator [Clostridia bacterium]|nr:RrF2 family transcriptional regulator [Clostridia bacterium]
MMISTRGRYALRMMADLALQEPGKSVALKDVAARQNISKKYLEQIIPILNRAGMLHTTRGFQGGYSLSRPPENYTVGEILRAAEGTLSPVACLEDDAAPCPRSDECLTLPVWRGLKKIVDEYLESITLRDVIDMSVENDADNYVI